MVARKNANTAASADDKALQAALEEEARLEQDERAPRDSETRDALAEDDDSWLFADKFPPCDLGPDWVLRWCRASWRNGPDPDDKPNMLRRIRQRWIPVSWEEATREGGFTGIKDQRSSYSHELREDGDVVEIEGMVLCKRSKVNHDKYKSVMRGRAQAAMDNLESSVARNQHDSMRTITQERKTNIGTGER